MNSNNLSKVFCYKSTINQFPRLRLIQSKQISIIMENNLVDNDIGFNKAHISNAVLILLLQWYISILILFEYKQ